MNTCKFCGITEETTHINRDKLCARCYRILEKVRQGRSTQEEKEWHDKMCEFNMKHNMFVPIAMRKKLLHLKPTSQWQCKKCGTVNCSNQDKGYKNYCVACADDIRMNRHLPTERKKRKDCGKINSHLKPYEIKI